ncbi:hypothetical protein GW17_00035182 [Ensete ventricosum]|nr:hypothetical protein GW17_00035182 [Ensete ventricosum]
MDSGASIPTSSGCASTSLTLGIHCSIGSSSSSWASSFLPPLTSSSSVSPPVAPMMCWSSSPSLLLPSSPSFASLPLFITMAFIASSSSTRWTLTLFKT